MSDWPKYQRGTVENLDTRVLNYEAEVPSDQYRVQVVPYGQQPVASGVSPAWHPYPYQITGLGPGRYDAFTLWDTPDGQHIIDHVGELGLPSFEVV